MKLAVWSRCLLRCL